MKYKFTVTVETDDTKFAQPHHIVESMREEVKVLWVTDDVKVTVSEAYVVG